MNSSMEDLLAMLQEREIAIHQERRKIKEMIANLNKKSEDDRKAIIVLFAWSIFVVVNTIFSWFVAGEWWPAAMIAGIALAMLAARLTPKALACRILRKMAGGREHA